MLELRNMASELSSRIKIPGITGVVFPEYFERGQPKECEFMVILLESGAAGISYVLVPDDYADEYRSLKPDGFIGTNPAGYIGEFGGDDPVKNMIGLAAINAVCQHVMRINEGSLDLATDSIGLIDVREGDKIGMVGFFRPLMKYIDRVKAELVIVEKNDKLLGEYPDLNLSLDPGSLNDCNKNYVN